MIAQLGMYDRPSTRGANDKFWSLIRDALGYGPAQLDRNTPVTEGWLHPDLLLSQTCGYPFRALLAGKVTLIGTPDYGLEGCPPGYYRSVFVARADDLRDKLTEFDSARFAYNEALSQSGWAAPRHHADQIGIRFGTLLQSGAHELSARAVCKGQADFASLDALTWEMIKADSPWAAELKVIGYTTPTPALPYISALGRDRQELFDAISAAISNLPEDSRNRLHLRGITFIPEEDYRTVPTPAAPDEM